MTAQEFKRKMKDTYPGKVINFIHNEAQNSAYLAGYLFYNLVYSDSVFIQGASGKSIGRAYAVEKA